MKVLIIMPLMAKALLELFCPWPNWIGWYDHVTRTTHLGIHLWLLC